MAETINEEKLFKIFVNVNDWLKFAEAKNAGLLALNLVSLAGILRADDIFKGIWRIFEGSLIILFCVSCCICIYTILPEINKWFRFYKKMNMESFEKIKDQLNILFFGDIAKLSSEQFVQLIEYKYEKHLTKSEKDFAHQITNNAEICLQKFSYSEFQHG